MSDQGQVYTADIPAGMFADSTGTPTYLGTQIYDQSGNLISNQPGDLTSPSGLSLNTMLLIGGGILLLILLLDRK